MSNIGWQTRNIFSKSYHEVLEKSCKTWISSQKSLISLFGQSKKILGSWQTPSRLSLLRRFNHVGYQNIWPCIPTYFFFLFTFWNSSHEIRDIAINPWWSIWHVTQWGHIIFEGLFIRGFQFDNPLIDFWKNWVWKLMLDETDFFVYFELDSLCCLPNSTPFFKQVHQWYMALLSNKFVML